MCALLKPNQDPSTFAAALDADSNDVNGKKKDNEQVNQQEQEEEEGEKETLLSIAAEADAFWYLHS